MADAQSTGERPSAAAQNAYNAATWTIENEYRISRDKAGIFDETDDKTYTGNFYYQGIIEDDGARTTDNATFRFKIDTRTTVSLGDQEDYYYLYDDEDNLLLYIRTKDTDIEDVTIDSSIPWYDFSDQSGDTANIYCVLPYKGYYSWKIKATWRATAGTNAGYYGIYVKQGQTDIPAYTDTEWGGGTRTVSPWLRIWAEDFSQLESIQPREDTTDVGISIDYHTSCRAGYDEYTEY